MKMHVPTRPLGQTSKSKKDLKNGTMEFAMLRVAITGHCGHVVYGLQRMKAGPVVQTSCAVYFCDCEQSELSAVYSATCKVGFGPPDRFIIGSKGVCMYMHCRVQETWWQLQCKQRSRSLCW